jgi:hypothetical protein
MIAAFTADNDEYIKFDRVTDKRSQRPDLHAFLLLDALVPGDRDLIGCAAHDEFFLDVDPDKLAAVITPEQIIELLRCGVSWDAGSDSLAMFA